MKLMCTYKKTFLYVVIGMFLLISGCQGKVERYVGKIKDNRAKEINEAVRKADVDKIKSILDRDSGTVNIRDSLGYTPLYWACLDGKMNVIEMLVSRGANVNSKGNDGNMPLHNAVRGGSGKAVEFLIKKGADVRARNKNGDTPLKIANNIGNKSVIDVLLLYGAKD